MHFFVYMRYSEKIVFFLIRKLHLLKLELNKNICLKSDLSTTLSLFAFITVLI